MAGKNAVDSILMKLPLRLREPLSGLKDALTQRATELVLRADRPVSVYCGRRGYFVTQSGALTDMYSRSLLSAAANEIGSVMLRLCNDSLYAFQDEINSGFVTIDGGVRVGLCGRAVVRNGVISNVRDITTLSFRIAREVNGCAEELLGLIKPRDGALICGVPGSGKTTVIRDTARLLSYRYRLSVLDERGELSAMSGADNGFDLGLSDVYCGYPKGAAAQAALRTMSPDIIVCDELGGREDVNILKEALRCGVSFIASAHASSIDDLRSRRITSSLLKTGAFRYIVFLSGKDEAGRIKRVYELSDADI